MIPTFRGKEGNWTVVGEGMFTFMVAQRQLDDSGAAMRVTQLIRFDDGTTLANTSIYRKQLTN